ncbi:putative Flavone synthase [Cocos nucifera]|uniref:Putative Flavone synthase n=1 Tax=Cocos nucifera TaxID=13894 RepID=A0A8K0I8K0_COCNU|nr:putative Flavone synthase [Cocos nucifera]
MASGTGTTIPTVDLSPFFHEDENGRKKATEIIHHACQTYGFFRIVNHGMSSELMARAIKLSKAFFELPEEEKLKFRPIAGSEAPLPAGYSRQPDHSPDKNEYLLTFSPELGFNLLPADPPEFRSVLDECFTQLTSIGLLVEEILNECMGLPPNFFEEYNKDRRSDFMTALRYFPATDAENNGISEHQDGNCLTFVFQDDVGGLDGVWISADPHEGSIIVNVGDIIQVCEGHPNIYGYCSMGTILMRGNIGLSPAAVTSGRNASD